MAEFSTPSSERWPLARCSLRAGWLAAALAAGLLAGSFGPATTQTVQGQLLQTGTGEPVEGALVLLLDDSGGEVGGYLTNQAGRFLIRAPGPGTYTLRAERIGYATAVSDSFSLDAGQQLGVRLETAESAIELEGIQVQGDQQCVVRPGEGLQLASVWDEARKALTVQDWTEREGSYRFQVTRYERDLDPLGRAVRAESRQTQSGVTGVPIRSLPAQDLMSEGFVRPTGDGGYDYFGPDASVLLSDEFLDTHCFRLALDPNQQNRVGLAFEPVQAGGIPDIAGTLWLDAQSATLRVLEYAYTWAPWSELRGVAKGRVEFENLPSGAWVVSDWWIRMPLAGQDLSMGLMQRTQGIRLLGIREVGGGISRYSSLEGGIVSVGAPNGVLEGRVWDSTSQAPLVGAVVFLSGTQYAAETDAAGTFLIPDLPEGIFTAVLTHPKLDTLGIVLPGAEVEIRLGEFTELALGIPSWAGILESVCSLEELAVGTGVVRGFVREAETGVPVAGAAVTVRWSTFEERAGGTFLERRNGLQATSDPTGRYSACGVPLDTTLRIQAAYLGRVSETVETLGSRDGAAVHLVIPGRGPTLSPEG